MDQLLLQLFAIQNLVFCLLVFVFVWAQRKLISLKFPHLESSKTYRELWVPLAPIGTGGILAAIMYFYPFPAMFATVWANRFAFGCICGLASGHAYKILKSFLKKSGDDSVNPSNDDL